MLYESCNTGQKITQGTVVYGVKSQKYNFTACYGVIITARCDIAQRKVGKYYYLTAVEAKDWLQSSVGYSMAYGDLIKSKRDTLCKCAEGLELNGEILLQMDNSELKSVLSYTLNSLSQNEDGTINRQKEKKTRSKIKDLSDRIAEYYALCCDELSNQDRKGVIKANPKKAEECLSKIDRGEYNHFYYLPQDAYLGNSIKCDGLIVDLLEIGSISLDDIDKISKSIFGGITFDEVPRFPSLSELLTIVQQRGKDQLDELFSRIKEHSRLTSLYWFKDESCFVTVAGTVKSPWCEHLMQRFSNAFIRIGVDNPSKGDFTKLVSQATMED